MRKRFLFVLSAAGLAVAALAPDPGRAATPTLTTLVSFYGDDGDVPAAGLIADARGNLFGTTAVGGAEGVGTVFEIRKTRNGYDTSPTILVNFDGSNGSEPYAGLLADAHGNLFGATEYGGPSNAGTVFEIEKTEHGYAGSPVSLVRFDGTDGKIPDATLIADGKGNLFGTTDIGGANGVGTVFEIVKTKDGYAGTPTILWNFDGATGANAAGGLIFDADDNLFGTTYFGGAGNDGTVYEIAKTENGYARTPTVLVSFKGADGENPYAGLTFDRHGNLFGTTIRGGAHKYGTAFEIAKTENGYADHPTTLFSFNLGFDPDNGAYPSGNLIADAKGNLFGTTLYGGASGLGTIFELIKTANGYADTPAILVSFNSFDGASPSANLIADAKGDLFGTTTNGGANKDGIVFKLSGSGFVPLAFAGAPGSADCYGESVLALLQQDRNLDVAAAAFGLDRAEALPTAILQYCAPSIR